MSVVCALRHEGELWLGCDTQARNNSHIFDAGPKWWLNGEWSVGVCGDDRVQRILEIEPGIAKGDPLAVCRALAKQLKDDGYKPKHHEDAGFEDFDACLVLAKADGFWFVDAQLTPSPFNHDFIARGCGCDLAYGAYFGAKTAGIDRPDRLVDIAVRAAMEYDSDCGGKVWVQRYGA